MKKQTNKKLDELLKDNLSEGSQKVPDFIWNNIKESISNKKSITIDSILKNNLSQVEIEVSVFVWENIEKEINKKKKRRAIIWFLFGIGGLLTMFLFINFLINSNSKSFNTAQNMNKDTNLAVDVVNYNKLNTPKKVNISDSVFNTNSKIVNSLSTKKEKLSDTNKNNRVNTNKSKSLNSIISKNINITSFNKNLNKSNSVSTKIALDSSGNKNYHLNNNKSIISDIIKINNNKNSDLVLKPDSSYNPLFITLNKNNNIIDLKNEPEISPFTNLILDSVFKFKRKKFTLLASCGYSMYDIAIYKNYFTSGQLSNRLFKSSGYEIMLGLKYNIKPKWTLYSSINYNKKQTSFNYNLVVNENAYFNYYYNNELIPLNLIDTKEYCDIFEIKNVNTNYKINSWLFSIGTTYNVFNYKKFSGNLDFRLSSNLISNLIIDNSTILKGIDNKKEYFNTLKPGLGLNLIYNINNNFSIGISPMYSFQFNSKKTSFYSKTLKELVVPIVFMYKF